jgi:hypothetical protein
MGDIVASFVVQGICRSAGVRPLRRLNGQKATISGYIGRSTTLQQVACRTKCRPPGQFIGSSLWPRVKTAGKKEVFLAGDYRPRTGGVTRSFRAICPCFGGIPMAVPLLLPDSVHL